MEIEANAYVDRVVQANGGDADAEDDDEEWMDTDSVAADDDGSDDELEYDFNELEVNGELQSSQYGGEISVLGFSQFRCYTFEDLDGLSKTAKEHLLNVETRQGKKLQRLDH